MSRQKKINTYTIVGIDVFIDVSTPKFPGKFAVIDLSDLHIAIDGNGRWHARSADGGRTIYATRDRARTAVQLHRHLFGLGSGHDPIIDHWDKDGLNNRRLNLRITDHSRNRGNGRASKDNKFKGVFYRKDKKTYRAIIQADGHRYHLGDFRSEEDAAEAYDKAALLFFGAFALTNFPNGVRR